MAEKEKKDLTMEEFQNELKSKQKDIASLKSENEKMVKALEEFKQKLVDIEEKAANKYEKTPVDGVKVDNGDEESNKYLRDKVPFKAYKDDGQYKRDIHTTYNGATYDIKRGVTVMIPRGLKLALEQADKQRVAAIEIQEELNKKFNPDRVALN